MEPTPPPTFREFFRLMLWTQWRALTARVRGLRQQSPLLILVLVGFVLGYLVVGYWLFRWGLHFLYHFPLVGALLSQRILFLIFGFFFVMLMFSNLIIGYSTLFKNRETQWFLSLPVRHRDVYRWKFLEALVVSSWALIFLSAPMMIAYGQVQQVPPMFYLQVALLYIPFVVLPALLGSWLILGLVRVVGHPITKRILLGGAIVTVLALVFSIRPVSDVDAVADQDVVSFDQLLRHTRLSLNPMLPSAWLAKSMLGWAEGLSTQGLFYFLVLMANALFGLLIGFTVMGKFFYGSWSMAQSSRAERFQRQAVAKRQREARPSPLEWCLRWLHPISQPTAALVLKDVRIFWRDPTQWIQFMIFFALLCIYVVNLRNVAFNFTNPFWEVMISHLNLAASALTLSTLTTRFVFPQFSLEGRRMWILGIAPVGLHRVMLQKFWLSCVTATIITTGLMIASSLMLHLPWQKVALFALAITLMSAALSGLSVGLGALFPNFKEENPSKIVSGFGGTLCLVVSFLYISLFVALFALPDLRKVTEPRFHFFLPDAWAIGIALGMSLLLLFIPLLTAARRVKRLEM
jgi:ABC-2 type transport system permease protein